MKPKSLNDKERKKVVQYNETEVVMSEKYEDTVKRIASALQANQELNAHIRGFYRAATGVEIEVESTVKTLANLSKEFGIVFMLESLTTAYSKTSQKHGGKATEDDIIKYTCGIARNVRNKRREEGLDDDKRLDASEVIKKIVALSN